MSLVPAKCTQCGANVEVDPQHNAWLCPHCGTPFIVEKAISNYNTVVNNTYNVDNRTVITGNGTVNVFEDQVNRIFVVEDGELTDYKGSKAKVKIPDGVLSVKNHIFLFGKDEVFVPASVVELNDYALFNCKRIIFADDSRLEIAGKGALGGDGDESFYTTNAIFNFPSEVKSLAPDAFGYRDKLICCKYPEETFVERYGANALEHGVYSRENGLSGEKMRYSFVFDFIRDVKTPEGFYVAVGKNSAALYGYDGARTDVLRAPSQIDGVKITLITEHFYMDVLMCGCKTLYLPEFTETVSALPSQCPCDRIYVPAGLKRYGAFNAADEIKKYVEGDSEIFIDSRHSIVGASDLKRNMCPAGCDKKPDVSLSVEFDSALRGVYSVYYTDNRENGLSERRLLRGGIAAGETALLSAPAGKRLYVADSNGNSVSIQPGAKRIKVIKKLFGGFKLQIIG